ncbi:MAG: hypothetical protein WA294_02090 [Acidobacteriaceae bacterium]
MIRYLLRLEPEIRYSFHLGASPLTEPLEQLVEGAIVHSIEDGGLELVPVNNAKAPSITLADWLGAAAR